MSDKRIHRLVVAHEDRVAGIVTSLDLLEHFGSRCRARKRRSAAEHHG
jgi:signal-transduction protein with cAMP-binding, CBS, and nucleotidyltransferase domain